MLDSIKKRRTQAGFTITELTTVVVVLGILLIPLSVLTINFFGGMLAKSAEAQLAVESQILLRSVVEELRLGSGVQGTNAIADANEPAAGWTTSNDDLVLIINTPALDHDRNFIIDPLTGSPYQNELIYFADGLTLYKRILAHPDATNNSLRTTCPAAAATSTCPPDRVLSKNFEDMNFTFYDQDDVVTTNLTLVRSLVVNVEMKKVTFGRDIEFSNAMRMTMRNQR